MSRTIVFAEFGINSNKNREHDFRNANPLHLIIGDVIFIISRITTIALIVSIVLSRSQKDIQKSGLFLIDSYRNLQIKIVM